MNPKSLIYGLYLIIIYKNFNDIFELRKLLVIDIYKPIRNYHS